MSEIILKPSKDIDFDINTLNKMIMSNESIDYNLYMNNVYSIEAIKMTKDEFEQRKDEIKEAAGKVYDKAVEFYKSKFDATVRPKLENFYEKMKSKGKIDENMTLEEFIKESESFITPNDKTNFVNSFINYIEDDETGKDACKIFTIDTKKIKNPEGKKILLGVLSGGITVILGIFLAFKLKTVLPGLATMIAGLMGGLFFAKKDPVNDIENNLYSSSNKKIKKSIKDESKMTNTKGQFKDFLKLEKKYTEEGVSYYLIPKIIIKG